MPSATDSVNQLLAENNIDRNHYAVFVPGSAHPDKCWPVEKFAALADKISPLFHLPIVLAGTKSERAVTEKLQALANVPIVDFAGITNLNELVALLKSARLVVSNDTGPGHIAAALGTTFGYDVQLVESCQDLSLRKETIALSQSTRHKRRANQKLRPETQCQKYNR